MLTCRLSGQHFRPCWSLPGSSCPWRSVLTPDAAEVSAHGRQAPPLAKARSCGQLVRLLITAKDAHAKRYSTRYSRVVTQRSTDLAQSRLPSVIGRERGYSGWYDRSMEAPQVWWCGNINPPCPSPTRSHPFLAWPQSWRCQLLPPAHPDANTSGRATCQRGLHKSVSPWRPPCTSM